MEALKQYWPWIVGAIVVLYALTRMRSRTILAPQTQFSEVAQPDPFAAFRSAAFEQLVNLGIVQVQADVERQENVIAGEVEIAKAGAFERAASRAANLSFLQRANDQEIQERAIDRYYSSRTQGDIIGSITGALSSIFGGRGAGVFGPRTPPINPNFGGF